MKQFLSVLAAGLIAGSLSMGAIAADAAKPAEATLTKKTVTTPVKKDTGIKASLKKLLPGAKKETK